MTPQWSRSERPASADELAIVKAHANDLAALGCAFVLWFPLATGGYLLGRSAGPSLELAAGIVLGLAAGMPSPLAFRRWRARSRRLQQQDLEAAVVEVQTVHGARAISIPGRHSSVDPAFAFELGGGRVLLLMGEWLCDPETYGGPAGLDTEDDRDDIANGLPPPRLRRRTHRASRTRAARAL